VLLAQQLSKIRCGNIAFTGVCGCAQATSQPCASLRRALYSLSRAGAASNSGKGRRVLETVAVLSGVETPQHNLRSADGNRTPAANRNNIGWRVRSRSRRMSAKRPRPSTMMSTRSGLPGRAAAAVPGKRTGTDLIKSRTRPGRTGKLLHRKWRNLALSVSLPQCSIFPLLEPLPTIARKPPPRHGVVRHGIVRLDARTRPTSQRGSPMWLPRPGPEVAVTGKDALAARTGRRVMVLAEQLACDIVARVGICN